MEPKKNPKKDLTKRSFLFFQIGLVVVLAITLTMIEWKTYDNDAIDTGIVNLDMLDEEDVPITEIQKTPPPPPPPPPAPEVIEVVEDDEDVEEVVIESTETDQNEVVEVEEVEEVEEEIGDVPFAVIESVPIFPGCEGLNTNDERKNCMSQKISKFVNKNFDTGLAADLGLSGINRVYVQFKIDKKGNIVNVAARAPHPRLQSEGERVIKKLPKMKPGQQRGQNVGVLYSLPITFKVQD
ncbi:energy transducer TonB [Psychroflexus gondwanensis]|jgi:protein TonB|uniref:Energy-transducer for outer membrane receptor/channel proteins TonB n=1 Tax=Psychroflexus gondwanensis ACAM 44 TaxID=1189619 RepID=N1WLV0_9FLAO|nr:energy transducer TonB [Psychroflexus gondwanensis]EMY81266.1 energy-transducer for outer membrane receptor/channel proteins TonB [Psychroflexus gondwanensis ACAM 44]TXE18153.1 energy transducer TonB [Psychroflexus gondwanensis]